MLDSAKQRITVNVCVWLLRRKNDFKKIVNDCLELGWKVNDNEGQWMTVYDGGWLWMTEWLRLLCSEGVMTIGLLRTTKGVQDCARLYAGCTGLCIGLYGTVKDVAGLWRTVRAGQCRVVRQDLAPGLFRQFRLVPVPVPRTFRFFYPLWIIAVWADSFGGNFSWSLKRDPAQQGRFYWLGKGWCLQKRRE